MFLINGVAAAQILLIILIYLENSLYSSLSILLAFIDLVYGLLNLSLNCVLKICENLIILFLFLVLIVFDNEPQTVAVAKAVGIE